MGILDTLFRKGPRKAGIPKSAAIKPAVIRTLADVRAFFLASTGDDKLSEILAKVADRTGAFGYLAIQQGGTGEPYSVEYMPTPEDDPRLPTGENKAWAAAYERLQQQIAATASASEREDLERKLAILTYSLCTLHIGTPSSADFTRQNDTIRRAWREFKAMANAKR